MNTLVLALSMVACCSAVPVAQPWTAYLFTQDPTPAVVRIPAPGLSFTFPQINTPVVIPLNYNKPVVPVPAPVPVFKAAAPVPVPVVKSVVPVPVVKAAVPVPVVKAASPAVVAAPVVVAAAPEPLNAPEPPMPSISEPFVGGQFHAQDEAKQYSFGHWGGPNTRVEVKDSLGRVSGSFAYVNPDGDVQVRKYAAAPGMGFKVAASDLPEDTPAVAQIKAAHAQAHAAAKL